MSDELIKKERAKWEERLGVRLDSHIMDYEIEIQDSEMKAGPIIDAVLDEVTSKSWSAGMNGAMNDGGAGSLLCSLEAWIAGLDATTPPEFGTVVKKLQQERNPDEYAEYLRLQKIYGD